MLQRGLGRLGLNSLGRMEAQLLATLDSVVDALCLLPTESAAGHLYLAPVMTLPEATEVLAEHAHAAWTDPDRPQDADHGD